MIRTMPRKSKRLPEGFFYRDLGRNMRVTRSAAGRSQGEVAEHLQVTFQQVQKYEAGTNRIPVDRLVSLSAFLDVPIAHFVGQTDAGGINSEMQSLLEHMGSKEFETLLRSWTAIKDQGIRAAILRFVESMAALRS
jgi:transcriptional regulator with XRE-family HTH domain